MFKNCVLKANVDTREWAKAAGIRAVKTMAQTFVATVGTAGIKRSGLESGSICIYPVRYLICSTCSWDSGSGRK